MSLPDKIVDKLLEADPVKDFLNRHSDLSNKFEQIDGDNGDPWLYGGGFWRPSDGMVVYFRGLEGEGEKDWDSWDIKLANNDPDLVAIMQQYPKDLDDDKIINDNERARDEAIENLRQARADAKNAATKIPVYRFTDEYEPENWMRIPEVMTFVGVNQKQWDEAPNALKLIAIGQFRGMDNFDSYPSLYSKAELSKFLGFEL